MVDPEPEGGCTYFSRGYTSESWVVSSNKIRNVHGVPAAGLRNTDLLVIDANIKPLRCIYYTQWTSDPNNWAPHADEGALHPLQ